MYDYRLKACRRCGGDLARDEGDWICLQCGSYSYVDLYGQSDITLANLLDRIPDSPLQSDLPQPDQNRSAGHRQRNTRVALSGLSRAGTARSVPPLSCPAGLP